MYLAEATAHGVDVGNYVDQYYTSGSFAKLREVSATYTFPERWVRGSQASFTLAARELHTWTNYNGIDPEASSLGTTATATKPSRRRSAASSPPSTIKW